jgi:hypothetical protein
MRASPAAAQAPIYAAAWTLATAQAPIYAAAWTLATAQAPIHAAAWTPAAGSLTGRRSDPSARAR